MAVLDPPDIKTDWDPSVGFLQGKMVVAFTGHRPDKIGGFDLTNPKALEVRRQMTGVLLSCQPEYAITGMALGVDQIAAEICIAQGLKFIAAIPFLGQEDTWPDLARKHYRFLLSQAHRVVTVCEGDYEPWKMQKRNEWMVRHSNVLIAVFDGSAEARLTVLSTPGSYERK